MSKGGNAIDGAITAALMLVLCEPQSTGLFGDAFAIIKSKKSGWYYWSERIWESSDGFV